MTSSLLAALSAGTAAALVAPGAGRGRVRARLVALWPAPAGAPLRSPATDTTPRGKRLAVVAAGLATAWLVGGATGLLLGVLGALALDRAIRRLPARADRQRTAAVAADLPLALNLIAACLQAGSPVGPTVEVVGTALGGPLGQELVAVAVSLRLGSPAEHAWSRLASDPTTRSVARAVVRVSDSGAALAALTNRLAEEQRDRMRLAADAAARRAGVLVVAPLGLCFLPAFLLLGVAPVVIGLASIVLG